MECSNKYVIKTESAINNDSKTFWSFVKASKAIKSPFYISLDIHIINNDIEIANCFADFFESAYRHSDADAGILSSFTI